MLPKEILKISVTLGKDPLIIQGGGGNISFKNPVTNTIWIKASGKWLANAEKEDVYVELDLDKGKEWLASGADEFPLDWQKNSAQNHHLRASIETSLHLLFDEAVVVHTHPVNVIVHAIQKNAEDILNARLANFNWALSPYIKPGRDLANAISKHSKFGDCPIFILENHGLVVCANDAEHAQKMSLELINSLSLPSRAISINAKLIESAAAKMASIGYLPPSNSKIHGLAVDPISLESIARINNVLYPDQAVFLGKNAYIIDGPDHIKASNIAPFVVVPNLGVFIHESASVMVESMLLCHAEVLSRITDVSQLHYLSDEQVAELTSWDAEKYRQSVN